MEKILQINELSTTVEVEQNLSMSIISRGTLENMVAVAGEETGHKVMYDLYEVMDDYFSVSVVLYKDSITNEVAVSEVFPNIDQIYASPFGDDKFMILWVNEE